MNPANIKRFKKISIIVPVYNEEKYIQETIVKIINVRLPNLIKELIIVNDGSSDNTGLKIKNQTSKLALKNRIIKIILINKIRNEGKGAAVKAGILKSTGDIVIIQDADLEYDPANYHEMFEPFFRQNADVVYGSRFISQRPHRVLYFWHYIGNTFLTILSNLLTNLNLTDMETGYKAFRGSLIRKIASGLKSNGFGFEPEVTAKVARVKNIRFYEVGISYFGRTYDEGKKISWKDGIKTIWEIIRFNLLN